MSRWKFTEEQVLFALKQAHAGQPVGDVCRQKGVSEASFDVWKKRYGSLGLLEVRELRQLRDENARLKRLVADLTLYRHILPEFVEQRSDGRPAQGHRPMDTGLLQLSVRRSCWLLIGLRVATWCYRSQARDRSVLRQRMRELATARPWFGYVRLHIPLTREG